MPFGAAMHRLASLSTLAITACAAPAPSEEGETISIDPDAKADAATEIKVKTTSLTVWMRPVASTRVEDGRTVFVLRGRASKNLDAVTPFIADDGFAQARTLSPRCRARHDSSAPRCKMGPETSSG